MDQTVEHMQKFSYILRLWRVNQCTTPDWRASLENPITGKRIGFANLEQLFAFLMDFSEENGDEQGPSVEDQPDQDF